MLPYRRAKEKSLDETLCIYTKLVARRPHSTASCDSHLAVVIIRSIFVYHPNSLSSGLKNLTQMDLSRRLKRKATHHLSTGSTRILPACYHGMPLIHSTIVHIRATDAS